MGLEFFRLSGSSVSFLSRGKTRPCFKDEGNTPDENDQFTIDVIGTEILLTNTLRRDVGNGSKEQDLDGDFWITEVTVSCETGSNTENEHDDDIM